MSDRPDFAPWVGARLALASVGLFLIAGSCATPEMLGRATKRQSPATQTASTRSAPAPSAAQTDQIGSMLGAIPTSVASTATVATMPLPETALHQPPFTHSLASFIHAPLSTLEAVIGSPSLKRQEGLAEFRRYDLPGCRVYAIVKAINQQPVIASVSIGAIRVANPAPSFGQCVG